MQSSQPPACGLGALYWQGRPRGGRQAVQAAGSSKSCSLLPTLFTRAAPLYSDYITIVNNAFVASGEGVAGIYEGGRNDEGEADGRGSYLYLARNRPPDRPPTYFQHAGLLPEPALPHTHRPLSPLGWQRLSGRVEARQAARAGELHLR